MSTYLHTTRPIISKNGNFGTYCLIFTIASAGEVSALVKHRLYWRVCNSIAHLIKGRGLSCVISLSEDSCMRVFLDDPYWSRMISKSYEYEPDFYRVLERLREIEFVFIDCGANFGYWSIILSSKAMRERSVLAIEASRETFEYLIENCNLNQNRFASAHYAISSHTGDEVEIDSPSGHAGAHIKRENLPTDTKDRKNTITTITLDDAVRQHFGEIPDYLLVKLDVEGEEINAFKGASTLLEKDVLFYYEDHGNDPTCKVTGFVLDQLGLQVFYCPSDSRLVKIANLEEAAKVKTRKSYGYNFLACKSSSRFLLALTGNV